MDTLAIDFVPMGLEEAWPARRWVEPIHGYAGDRPRGLRLGHATASTMVLTCTFPRDRFDAEVGGAGSDPVREVAFETTFALVNLALHQIRVPGERPEGLVGSLMQFANQQANRYRDWATVQWGEEDAAIVGMAGWQSGFSLAYPDVYVIAHACGVGLDSLQLEPVNDMSGYELSTDPNDVGAMHWELWRSEPAVGYEDLAKVLVAP